MKEYRIIKQIKDALPFSLWTFNSFDACYAQLQVLIQSTGDYFHKDYYVFNDFYENEFTPDAKVRFKIEVREVGNWETYGEASADESNNTKKIIKIY